MKSENELIEDLLDLAFAEDIGDGDHTTLCCIPESQKGKAQLLIKEEGVLAGVEIAKRVFAKFDPELQVEVPDCRQRNGSPRGQLAVLRHERCRC